MTTGGRLRVGYLLADPGLDLSMNEMCRVQVERVVHSLREDGHEVNFVAVQPGEVVLTDTGFGLQQFFESARDAVETDDEAASHTSRTLSAELLRFAQQNQFPLSELETSNLAFCAGRRLFRDCDLIHVRLSPTDVGGLLCARALKIPLLVEVETPPLPEAESSSREPLHREAEGPARIPASHTLRDARAVVTFSTTLRDALVSNWAVHPEAISVFPNGADAPPPTSPDRIAQLRREYELGVRPVVIFVTGWQSGNGLDAMLDAWVSVTAKQAEVTLLVVGEGPWREKMEERARSLSVSKSVRFIGQVAPERLGQLLSVAEVAVAPEAIELDSTPIEIVEFMAAGKAIVAPRLPPFARILSHEESALLVEPGNQDALAQAIGKLLGASNLRRRLGDGARHRAERDHSWAAHARRLATVYETVASTAGRWSGQGE